MKTFLLYLVLVSFPLDVQLMPSMGIAQRYEFDDSGELAYGVNYNLSVEGYFPKYFGVGLEIERKHFWRGSDYEEDTLASFYFLCGLPLSKNSWIFAHMGVGDMYDHYVEGYWHFGEELEWLLLKIGFRVRYHITDHVVANFLFDEKIIEGRRDKVILYDTISFSLGYLL